jgi:N-acetylmuramoyl-L-alanine amidase
LCKTIKPILEDLGYKTFIDVEDDSISDELKTRCKIVNELHKKYKNCIYVSIHLNAAGSDGKWHNGTGWEIYTSPGKTKSDRLATCLYESAKKNLPNVKFRTDFSDGDPDKEANLYVLKNTNCPAVLTENMF